MRKLALLLGSLVVVASAAAKEVVPAPVVVEEAPVQIVEKEVIVYRDKEEGFRPNGYVDLQYRWYGDTEGQNDNGDEDWNSGNNYSRIQLQGKINMTEKQALEYRIRNYGDLDHEPENRINGGTDTRLRYFYNHGYLGDSKVNLTSRVHYRDREDTAKRNQELEYSARFNFAEYMFNNDFVKTNEFTIAPKYAYVWGPDNSDNYDNRVGVDLASTYELPWGFSAEFNIYATQHFYGEKAELVTKDGKEDKNFTVDVEAYIYNTTNLYTNGNFSVDFNFEGGYDPYTWSQEKEYDSKTKVEADDSTYSLYALPTVQVNYQATPNVVVYAAAGAEYRNWQIEEESEASNWRWQPTVFAGFKTTF